MCSPRCSTQPFALETCRQTRASIYAPERARANRSHYRRLGTGRVTGVFTPPLIHDLLFLPISTIESGVS